MNATLNRHVPAIVYIEGRKAIKRIVKGTVVEVKLKGAELASVYVAEYDAVIDMPLTSLDLSE